MAKMKPQYFRLVNETIRDNCVKAIFIAQQQSDEVIAVKISTQQEQRSNAQNRLYWLWIKTFSDYTGNTKERQHRIFKRQYLSRILIRKDEALNATLQSVAQVKQYMSVAEYEEYALKVASLISTTKASVDEMSEYLNDIEKFCYSEGCFLPIPEDLAWAK